MDAEWCVEVLEETAGQHRCPEIINTDQESQFISKAFTEAVLFKGIRLSIDRKGRAIDDMFIEPFWRTGKCEKIYLNSPADGLGMTHGRRNKWIITIGSR